MSSNAPTAGDAGIQSESFVANTLSASLTVAGLDASLAWYRDVLGFTVTRTHERAGKMFAVSLKAGAVAVLLTQDDGAKGTDRQKGEGISLRLTTSQDIDILAARIKARGGVLDSEPADGFGVRVFRVRDPEGFKLVITSEP